MDVVDYSPLVPTDVAEVARIHQRGFAGFFLSTLGLPFLRQFYAGHIGDPTAVSVVARIGDGRPVGVVVGTTQPAGFYGRLLRRRGVAFAAAGAWGALHNPRAVPRLVRALTYRGDAPEPSYALLSSIVVDPVVAGQGVGWHLQDEWCRLAAEAGATHAYLQTDHDDNEATLAFYRRCGWTEAGLSTTPEGRRLTRFERDLTPRTTGETRSTR